MGKDQPEADPTDIVEMVWGAVLLFGGLVAADFYLIRRSTDRMIDRAMERPAFKALKKMEQDPAFSKIACDALESIVAINKFVREDLPEVKDAIQGFARAQKLITARKPKRS